MTNHSKRTSGMKNNTDKAKANHEIAKVQAYLKWKGVKASEAEIVIAAIKIAKRLGAGDWTFVCELE